MGDQPLARLNLDRLLKFSDGSQFVLRTQAAREGYFPCELFIVGPKYDGREEFDSVSGLMQRSSPMEAQDLAYDSAQRLYPTLREGTKKPPYLI